MNLVQLIRSLAANQAALAAMTADEAQAVREWAKAKATEDEVFEASVTIDPLDSESAVVIDDDTFVSRSSAGIWVLGWVYAGEPE